MIRAVWNIQTNKWCYIVLNAMYIEINYFFLFKKCRLKTLLQQSNTEFLPWNMSIDLCPGLFDPFFFFLSSAPFSCNVIQLHRLWAWDTEHRWLKIVIVEYFIDLNNYWLNILQRCITHSYFSNYLSVATWVGSVSLLIRWATPCLTEFLSFTESEWRIIGAAYFST